MKIKIKKLKNTSDYIEKGVCLDSKVIRKLREEGITLREFKRRYGIK